MKRTAYWNLSTGHGLEYDAGLKTLTPDIRIYEVDGAAPEGAGVRVDHLIGVPDADANPDDVRAWQMSIINPDHLKDVAGRGGKPTFVAESPKVVAKSIDPKHAAEIEPLIVELMQRVK